MKKLLTPLLLCGIASSTLAGGASGGPWANGAYYAGYLNGKYMGVVTGNNIAGVLGFAISDGAPPFRREVAQTGGGVGESVLNNAAFSVDPIQNYFAIFVEGRTYTGLTTAGVDIDSNTVAGALQGTGPAAVLPPIAGAPGPGAFNTGLITSNTQITTVNQQGVFTNFPGTTNQQAVNLTTNVLILTNVTLNFADPPFNNALSILSRGLSGGFTAKIKSKGAVFTFKGDGQLSTPANRQTYNASGFVQQKLAGTPPINVQTGQLTNLVVSGQYETEMTSFRVRGIRTSFGSLNLQDSIDRGAAASAASTGTGGGGTGN